MANNTSPGHASDGRSVSTWASHIELNLLGLASQAHEGSELHEPTQASFIEPVAITQSDGCLYHQPILLMRDTAGGSEQSLDPMARWLAEDHIEECAILHLHDGRLSIHKECQCNDVLQPGTELEMDTEADSSH